MAAFAIQLLMFSFWISNSQQPNNNDDTTIDKGECIGIGIGIGVIIFILIGVIIGCYYHIKYRPIIISVEKNMRETIDDCEIDESDYTNSDSLK